MTERPHGRAKYVAEHCPCAVCNQANTDYENNRARQQTYGRWNPYVDADPVREHVQALRAAGLGLRRISAMSGVCRNVLRNLMSGSRGRPPCKRVRPETADRIFAVQPAALGGRRPVTSPSRRPEGRQHRRDHNESARRAPALGGVMTATVPAFAGSANEDWRDSALCAQTDPEVFFPEKGQPGEEAKRVCMGCEVLVECRADALSLPTNQDRFGVRGGLSATERARLRKEAS